MDCSETESFYSINEKIGSEEPIADDIDKVQRTGRKRKGRKRTRKRLPEAGQSFGIGSSSILEGRSGRQEPLLQLAVDIVQYDATIPEAGNSDLDYDDQVPLLLADAFSREEAGAAVVVDEQPINLYGAPRQF